MSGGIKALAVSLSLALASIVSAAGTAAAGSAGDPVAVIKKKDAELQKMLRDPNKKTDRIKVLINGIFDFQELGRRALGPDTWKTMTPDQQKRFVTAFKNMVENASVKKLEAYQSDSTSYEAPEIEDGAGPSGRTASVTSHVWNKGSESIVTYKLQVEGDTAWKAWDLIIDDLSTARNYGEQFHKILQTSNIDGLIAKLEKKAASERSAGAADGKAASDNVKAKSEKAGAQPAAKKTKAGGSAAAKPASPATASSKSPSATP
jgi:phospholipid transport system substrate-binding protein